MSTESMKFEVEQKFAVGDFAMLESRLLAIGATPGEPAEQIDTYYSHPARDFAESDEALRIRSIDRQNYITYKGPKIDHTTKTRREIELALPQGKDQPEEFGSLLRTLGFQPVKKVRKLRHPFNLTWEGRLVEAALDEVDGLGCFVELEFIASAEELAVAKHALESLVAELQLGQSERRSYLEMLLEQ